MKRLHPTNSLVRWGLPLWLGVFALAALPACQGQGSKKKKPSAAASASGSAGVKVATGPCADYATKLCEKAGPESPTCQSIKTTTELMPPAACKAGMKDIGYSAKKLSDKRKACDDLTQKLCAAIGPKTQTCEMVKTQTKNFPPERCTTMLEHMPEIVADLKKMEAANQPLSQEQQTALAAGPVPSFGPENAKVTIVEFSDFQCPYCSRAAEVVTKIKEKYSGKVRLVFRQYPLPMHPQAQGAAEASLAANAQGKFWEYHDAMFQGKKFERADLEEYAKKLGLNLETFKKALDDKQFAPAVAADMKLGEGASVQGTPTMFINGKRVQNPTSFESISSMIDTELKGGSPG